MSRDYFRQNDPTPVAFAVAEATGTTDGGGDLTGENLNNVFVVPGSVSIEDGTNTWTESEPGVLVGAPAGTGTINYETGAIVLASADTSAAVTATYSYFSAAGKIVTNAPHPTFIYARAFDAQIGIMIRSSENQTDWTSALIQIIPAWGHEEIGVAPGQFIEVSVSGLGNYGADPVNAI